MNTKEYKERIYLEKLLKWKDNYFMVLLLMAYVLGIIFGVLAPLY